MYDAFYVVICGFCEEDDGGTSIFMWFSGVFVVFTSILCESYKRCIKENKRKCKTDEEEGVH